MIALHLFLFIFVVNYSCALPYYDAIVVEGRDDSDEDLIGLDNSQSFTLEDCLLPPMAGPCRAGIPMYYFNKDIGKCMKFRYGGCGGNSNRFQSRNNCERRCTRAQEFNRPISNSKPIAAVVLEENVDGDLCERDPAVLNCRGQGCFASRDEYGCYQCRCASDATTSNYIPTSTYEPNSLGNDVCYLPPQRGHCRALLPRWTYDSITGRCKEFRFGGCDGNANNFLTEAECQTTCGGRRRRQQSNNDYYQSQQQEPQLQETGTTNYSSAFASMLKQFYRRFWQ